MGNGANQKFAPFFFLPETSGKKLPEKFAAYLVVSISITLFQHWEGHK